jgi:uncharacterized membrane protein YvbJ
VISFTLLPLYFQEKTPGTTQAHFAKFSTLSNNNNNNNNNIKPQVIPRHSLPNSIIIIITIIIIIMSLLCKMAFTKWRM